MKCCFCNSYFSGLPNLRKHIKIKHPEKDVDKYAPTLLSQREYKFECEFCQKHFSTVYKLRYHVKLNHCAEIDDTRSQIVLHSNFREFLKWKVEIENETKAFFKKRGHVVKGGKVFHYFICHRSGTFVSRGKGIRRMPKKGSCKINRICPAKMTAIESENEVKTTFYPDHTDHDVELVGDTGVNRIPKKQSSLPSTNVKIVRVIAINVLDDVNEELSEDNFGSQLDEDTIMESQDEEVVDYREENNGEPDDDYIEENCEYLDEFNQENECFEGQYDAEEYVLENQEGNNEDIVAESEENIKQEFVNDNIEDTDGDSLVECIEENVDQKFMVDNGGETDGENVVEEHDHEECANGDHDGQDVDNSKRNFEKEECRKQFLALLDSADTPEEMAVIKKSIQNTRATLTAVSCLTKLLDSRSSADIPAESNLHSTNSKSRVKRSIVVKHFKPTVPEAKDTS